MRRLPRPPHPPGQDPRWGPWLTLLSAARLLTGVVGVEVGWHRDC